MGKKPKMPSVPEVPEITPTITAQFPDAGVQAVGDQSRRQNRFAGLQSTILTGGSGLESPRTGRTVLGG